MDGVRHYVTRTGNQVDTVVITQSANTLLYDLPIDCIRVKRVLWNSGSKNYHVEPTTPGLLDKVIYQWTRMTDVRARNYFIFGLDKIALWPMCTTSGGQYTVHYQKDVYSSLTLVPENDQGILVNYVTARYLMSEGKVKEAVSELEIYNKAVRAACRRMSNPERVWKMSSPQAIGSY